MAHACPRPECPRTVPDDLFACRPDWYALPPRLRDAIWSAFRDCDEGAHLAAMAEAIAWYREHPPRWATEPGAVVRRGRTR
jgi:hypothetical protein